MAMSLEERQALQGMGKALARRRHRHHYSLPLGPPLLQVPGFTMRGGTMGKVYIVTSGEYSDYSIEACFSTKALAEAYLRRARPRPALSPRRYRRMEPGRT